MLCIRWHCFLVKIYSTYAFLFYWIIKWSSFEVFIFRKRRSIKRVSIFFYGIILYLIKIVILINQCWFFEYYYRKIINKDTKFWFFFFPCEIIMSTFFILSFSIRNISKFILILTKFPFWINFNTFKFWRKICIRTIRCSKKQCY